MLNSDDLTRTVSSFLASVAPPSLEHVEVQQSRSFLLSNRALKIEAKFGRFLDKNTGQRVQLPILSETGTQRTLIVIYLNNLYSAWRWKLVQVRVKLDTSRARHLQQGTQQDDRPWSSMAVQAHQNSRLDPFQDSLSGKDADNSWRDQDKSAGVHG